MRGLAWLSLALLAAGCTEYDLDNNPGNVGGPRPDIEVDPMVLSWGVKLPNCPSDPKVVTIRNVGQSQLRVSELRLTGDASAYTSDVIGVIDPPITLATGEATDVSLEFLAATTVAYSADLEIVSNDPDEGLVMVDLSGEGGNNPSNEDVFEQEEPEAVDVLWVLDYSCSMSDVVTELETRFDEFIDSFVDLGLDYQIGVTTADMDATGPQGQLLDGRVLSSNTMTSSEIVQAFDDMVNPNSGQSGTEKVLGAAWASLEDPAYAVNAGLVRPNGNLAVIVIGDEDDQSSRSASQYVQWMNAYKPDPDMTSISGIVPMSSGGSNLFDVTGCIDFMGLPKIRDAISGTGGEQQNLCTLSTSFADIMDWLSFTAAGLDTMFGLSSTPAAGAAGMTVTVNGVQMTYDPFQMNGWDYDPATNQVRFYGSAIPGPGATVVVTYPVAGTCTTN